MIRFLFGIVLMQLVTVALVYLSPELQGMAWLRLVIPLLVIGLFGAFWFSSIAKHQAKDAVRIAVAEHAKEKEKIQIKAEKEKVRLIKKTQQQITKENNSAHRKANVKVGAAFATTIGFGAILLLTELLLLGMLTMSTAGGALGGYLWRAKKGDKRLSSYKTKQMNDENEPLESIKVIKKNEK